MVVLAGIQNYIMNYLLLYHTQCSVPFTVKKHCMEYSDGSVLQMLCTG